MTKTLFIGGPHDALWVEIPEEVSQWAASDDRKLIIDSKIEASPQPSIVKTVVYRRETLRGKNSKYSVMVHLADNECPIEALLSGYRGANRGR